MKLNKGEKWVQIPRKFWAEMSEEEFHQIISVQGGCINRKQRERIMELKKETRTKKAKQN